jgi:hypothetical protein
MPFIPLYTTVSMLGIKAFYDKLKNVGIKLSKVSIYLIVSFATIYISIMLLTWASTFGWNVENINDMQVKIGYWVKNNTKANSTVVLNDIGAITYISDRIVIDTVGLVSPDVLNAIKNQTTKTKHEEKLWEYLVTQKFDYVIIFPSWYPNIAQKPQLHELYRIRLEKYTIVDGEMVVYKYQP